MGGGLNMGAYLNPGNSGFARIHNAVARMIGDPQMMLT